MKMNVATRLTILANLPEQGSVLEMITKRNIRKKIDFTSSEISALNLVEANGRISWTNEDKPLEVSFNDSEKKFLNSIIEILDNKHIITDNILDFIEELRS